MRSVELFAGAGGLALGISAAGFRHDAVVEWDHDACETIRENQGLGSEYVRGWPLHEGDVKDFSYSPIPRGIDLLAGGPPCQPFSMAGKHRGHEDDRNMFPEVVRAIRELQPKAILVENVKGLARPAFADFVEYTLQQMRFPEVLRKPNEDWLEHAARLKKYKAGASHKGLTYDVQIRLLNAANYGVPQRRERVIIVGFRSDLKVNWTYPAPTHSQDALIYSQWVTGEYWERHKVAKKDRPTMPEKYAARVRELSESLIPPKEKPWLTVRDALVGLPDPEKVKQSKFKNHVFNPGARAYPGHTGSPLDEPAKTLKAGDHGVPGGENMLARPDGTVRYFTVRESARIQTFPDDYVFRGAWSEAMRQLGNAVPMRLAQVMAERIKTELGASAKSKDRPTKHERTRGIEQRISL